MVEAAVDSRWCSSVHCDFNEPRVRSISSATASLRFWVHKKIQLRKKGAKEVILTADAPLEAERGEAEFSSAQ